MIDTEKLSRLLEELNIAVDGYAAQRLDLYASDWWRGTKK